MVEVLRGGQGFTVRESDVRPGDIIISGRGRGGRIAPPPPPPPEKKVKIDGSTVFVDGQGFTVRPSDQAAFIQQQTGGRGSSAQLAIQRAEAEVKRIAEQEAEQTRLEAEKQRQTTIEFQSRQLEFERAQREFVKQPFQQEQFTIRGEEYSRLELIRLGIEGGIGKFPGETESEFRSRAISMGRGVAYARPEEAKTFIKGGVTVSKATLDKLQSERDRILKEIRLAGMAQAEATTTQEKIAKGRELQNLRKELREVNRTLGKVGGFVEITKPEEAPPTTFEKIKEKVEPITERYKKAEEKLRKEITEPLIFAPLERRGLTPARMAEIAAAKPFDIIPTPPKLKLFEAGREGLKEFQIGFIEGQLVDIREKPLKQVALVGAGFAGGYLIKGIGVGAKVISPVAGKIIGGTGKAIGVGMLGYIGFSTGEQIISAADPREAGKVVGVTFKDVLLISAGAKAGAKLIKTKSPADLVKLREKALEAERLKRLGLGGKAKIETVGAVQEVQIRNDIVRNLDDPNLIRLVKKGSIGKVKRFNVKTKRFDERIILRNVERIDGVGRETTITFKLTKTGRLLKPRVLITDLKSGESLLLRPASPSELRKFDVGGIKIEELPGTRLKVEQALLGKGKVKVVEFKINDKVIRLLEKRGIVFQIGGRGRGTLSTADLQRLGKTPLVIRKIKPIPVGKLTSTELQILKQQQIGFIKGQRIRKGIVIERTLAEQISKLPKIKVKKIRPMKSFADEIADIVKPRKFPKPKKVKLATEVILRKPAKVFAPRIPSALGFEEQIITIPTLPRQPPSATIIFPTRLPGEILPLVTGAEVGVEIQLPTSSEIDKAITRLRQQAELKLKPRVREELVAVAPSALDLLGVSELTKQQQKQQQKQIQKLTTRQRLDQKTIQRAVSAMALVPAIPKPPKEPPPTKPSRLLVFEKKKKLIPTKQPGYWPKAQPIHQKKFIRLTKVPVTKQQAEDISSFLVDNSLSTNWKIEKAKGRLAKEPKLDIPKGYFKNTAYKWRDFRIRKGKKIPTPNSYVERIGISRLDTLAERSNIQLFRALKLQQQKSTKRRKALKPKRRKPITFKVLQKRQPQKQIKSEDLFAPIEFPSVF